MDNIKELGKNVENLTFKPTEAQQNAKAQFLSNLSHIWHKKDNLSIERIIEMSGTERIRTWAKDPNFWGWFYDDKTTQTKINAATELAVEALTDILKEQDVGPKGKVTASGKARAAELLLNYAGYKPATKTEHTEKSKEGVDGLDKAELIALLDNYRKSLGEEDE